MSYKEYMVKVYDNGDKLWYFNGNLHRKDGPAIENATGTKVWFLNGKYHRVDGPAIEYAGGNKYWYLNGEPLSEAEFNFKMSKTSCEGKIVVYDGIKYKLQRA